MAQQQVQQEPCVVRIVLGAGSTEPFPVSRCGGGVHREQHQVGVLGQHIDQSSARLLQTYSDGAAAKPLLQARGPSLHRLRRVLQFPLLLLLAAGWYQFPVMLLVGPVDGYKRGPFWFGFRRWHRIRHCYFISLLERAGRAPTKASPESPSGTPVLLF